MTRPRAGPRDKLPGGDEGSFRVSVRGRVIYRASLELSGGWVEPGIWANRSPSKQ